MNPQPPKENNMTDHERDEWIKVADKLGVTKSGSPLGVGLIRVKAMLHGLACLAANGRCWWAAGGAVWYWDINGDMGEAKSHPAALLAMLEAHGGES